MDEGEPQVPGITEEFLEDSKALSSLESDDYETLERWLLEFINSRIEGAPLPDIDDLVETVDLDREVLGSALAVLDHSRQLISEHNEISPQTISDQLKSSGHLPDEHVGKFQATIEALADKAPRYPPLQTTYSEILPTLTDALTRCTLVPIFDPEYTTLQDVSDYQPNIVGYQGAVVLHLDVEGPSGEETISIAVNPSDVDSMISRLTFARKQLNLALDDSSR